MDLLGISTKISLSPPPVNNFWICGFLKYSLQDFERDRHWVLTSSLHFSNFFFANKYCQSTLSC